MADRNAPTSAPSLCPNHWHCVPLLAAHNCDVDRSVPCPTCDQEPEPRVCINSAEQAAVDLMAAIAASAKSIREEARRGR